MKTDPGQPGAPATAEMLFIVGRARSGTTLLQLMLDAHPRISVPPECQFIMNLMSKYGRRDRSRVDPAAFVRDVWREERIATWGLDRRAVVERVAALPASSGFAELCGAVYEEYAVANDHRGAAYHGDNNHHYSLFVDVLATRFPGARFIHLVREYRANVLSHQKVDFESNDAAVLAHRWRTYHRLVRTSTLSASDRMILVRYEDLVSQPQHTMRRICGFLGLEFHPAMLAHHERQRPEYRDPWHSILDQPVSTSRIAAWQAEMSDADATICQKICAGEAHHYGYEDARVSMGASGHLRDALGRLRAAIRTVAERAAFRLPVSIRSLGIALHRRWNRTI